MQIFTVLYNQLHGVDRRVERMNKTNAKSIKDRGTRKDVSFIYTNLRVCVPRSGVSLVNKFILNFTPLNKMWALW